MCKNISLFSLAFRNGFHIELQWFRCIGHSISNVASNLKLPFFSFAAVGGFHPLHLYLFLHPVDWLALILIMPRLCV